ncbi:hypothetical protein SKAU_G00118220 [Synaphobranchus kaupii]|uniref:Uncharacterized protein n=1 Tax=Synaphobranchus kaupii TaxID=118154 RepID=A0A9Q1J1S4_SYNKA|nr:hypothetical protein SKAU_G00118220 [Synaphobranchus kaupii]
MATTGNPPVLTKLSYDRHGYPKEEKWGPASGNPLTSDPWPMLTDQGHIDTEIISRRAFPGRLPMARRTLTSSHLELKVALGAIAPGPLALYGPADTSLAAEMWRRA